MTANTKMPEAIYAWFGKEGDFTGYFSKVCRSMPQRTEYIRADLSTPVPPEDARRALEDLNGLVFSDGAGAVCGWFNNHQKVIRTLLEQAAGGK
jgi:hypothetical protein